MAQTVFIEAINQAFIEEMRRDEVARLITLLITQLITL